MPRGRMNGRRCDGDSGGGGLTHVFEHSPFRTVGSSAAYRGSKSTSAERTKFPGRREKSREFLRFSCFLRKSVSKTSAKQYLAREFPMQTSRELFRARRELIPGLAPDQGIWREIDSCAPTYQTAATSSRARRARTPHFSAGRPSGDRVHSGARTFASLKRGSGGVGRAGFPNFGRPWQRGALAPESSCRSPSSVLKFTTYFLTPISTRRESSPSPLCGDGDSEKHHRFDDAGD
jgi:hypothetical protein